RTAAEAAIAIEFKDLSLVFELMRTQRDEAQTFGFCWSLACSSARTAASAAWKPTRLCVPSQKGLLTEPPQRQSAKFVFPVKSYFWPSASTSSTEPSGASTRNGPFFLAMILICAMILPPVE